jgi:very-short-patch-repair endonuclease
MRFANPEVEADIEGVLGKIHTLLPLSGGEARPAEALQAHGYRVMRFINPEVEADIEGVPGNIHTLLPLRGGD